MGIVSWRLGALAVTFVLDYLDFPMIRMGKLQKSIFSFDLAFGQMTSSLLRSMIHVRKST
jgi:hypothetical protein